MWAEYVNVKNTTIPDYPISVKLHKYDIKGNCTLISQIMERRLSNKLKAPIVAIVAEGNLS